jgi:hypothetical protein
VNPWLTQLVHASNGRPFTADELDKITQYVEFLPDALAAVKKLDENQKWLVRHLGEWVAPKAQEWGLPKDPFTTDFAAFLAAVGHALLCDDITLLDTSVITPCRGLADALEIPAAEFAGLFDEAWRVLQPRLDPLSAQLIQPFLGRVAGALRGDLVADIAPAVTPAPAMPAPALVEV